MATPGKKRITIKTFIKQPIDQTWDIWTTPEHITQWNFANDDWQCPSAENDLRVGGTYKARMEAKDGSFGFDFEAVYDEVVDHQKITYTMTDGRQATTDFENINNTTKVTITFDAETENPIEMQKDGWQAILDNFRKYAETKN